VADRSLSVPMTLSDLEGWDVKGQTFLYGLLNLHQPFDLERSNSAGHHRGVRGVFLWVKHAPILRRRVPASQKFTGPPTDAGPYGLTYSNLIRHGKTSGRHTRTLS